MKAAELKAKEICELEDRRILEEILANLQHKKQKKRKNKKTVYDNKRNGNLRKRTS